VLGLIKYDEACLVLAQVAKLDEAKTIQNKADALRVYSHQAHNLDMEADAWAIRKRAEDRLGELSLELEKAHKAGRGCEVQFPIDGKSKKQALEEAGISTSAAQRYERFHLLPEWEKRARIEAGKAAIRAGRSLADVFDRQNDKKRCREARELQLGQIQCALPKRKYGVIVADPEWLFQPWSRETGMDRAADNHYPTSAIDVIKTRDVAAITADDCALFLWATQPMLPQALDVMESWGFDYKSHIVWLKDRIGTGYWFRNKHELLLLGTRGSPPCPALGQQWDSVWEAARRGHSEKPEIFLEMIECYFPTLPKIELNRRGPPRRGWDAWGAEAEPSRKTA